MTLTRLLIFLFVGIGLHTKAQTNIVANYISLNLISPDNKRVEWQPIHKKTNGNFKLNWLKNGNISMQYNVQDTPTIHEKISKLTNASKSVCFSSQMD